MVSRYKKGEGPVFKKIRRLVIKEIKNKEHFTGYELAKILFEKELGLKWDNLNVQVCNVLRSMEKEKLLKSILVHEKSFIKPKKVYTKIKEGIVDGKEV